MFQSMNHFPRSWEFETEGTQRLLDHLTDEALDQKITSENWNLGRIAWHIIESISIITSNTDLKFESPAEGHPVPKSAQFISACYQQTADAFIKALKAQWNDQTLDERIDFFGREIPNGSLLMFLLQHQCHHRGQMTVLMRQAGLAVPGIYGPLKEEWAKMGMEAPSK